MGFKSVMEPLSIRNFTLPNRIVFPAFQTNHGTKDGYVTEKLMEIYGKLARGGSGLIIVGCMAVTEDGATSANVLRINSDKHLNGLKELFSVIRRNGSIPAAQLVHAGRQTLSAITGHPLVAPSAIPCPVMKEIPVELDTEGILKIQDDFAEASLRAKKAGAEMIELHGAFGYLIGGFLSPFSNKRTDEYGTDRTLFFTQIIEKVRHKIGDTPIICRISGDEYVEGGLALSETRKIAPELVRAGADIINVGAGTYASMDHMAPTIGMGDGPHVHLATKIREVVNVPVICVGNIRTLQYADKIISEKKADLVAICRPQAADFFFVEKSVHHQEPVECNKCNNCLQSLFKGEPVSCPQNPEL